MTKSIGVGTDLSDNTEVLEPLNMVIKMYKMKRVDHIKLSDIKEKATLK